MRCPTLAELPQPPAGRSGWPWTLESVRLPNSMADGRRWPRISIVTPSYNQGQYIEETIRSVLLQAYPDLEYFVMDGGSADGTVQIIEKYSAWLRVGPASETAGRRMPSTKAIALPVAIFSSGSIQTTCCADRPRGKLPALFRLRGY